MAQIETAAQQYARLKEETFEAFLERSFSDDALKDVELFEVPCPSTMVFKCRRPDANYIANAGQMPMALSGEMVAAQNSDLSPEERDKAAQERFEKMTPMEQRAAIQSSGQALRYCAVEPRLIMGEVNGHKNAISVDALTMADFTHLAKWIGGGDAAQGLKTFRKKRR